MGTGRDGMGTGQGRGAARPATATPDLWGSPQPLLPRHYDLRAQTTSSHQPSSRRARVWTLRCQSTGLPQSQHRPPRPECSLMPQHGPGRAAPTPWPAWDRVHALLPRSGGPENVPQGGAGDRDAPRAPMLTSYCCCKKLQHSGLHHQPKVIILTVLEIRGQRGSHRAKTKVSAGLAPSGNSRENLSPAFPPFKWRRAPRLVTPSRNDIMVTSDSTITSPLTVCLPLRRSPGSNETEPSVSQENSPTQILSSVTSSSCLAR